MNTVIIIPIYKKTLEGAEKASLKRCFEVLGKYSIKFVCPNKLDTSFYKEMAEEYGAKIDFVRFREKYFASVQTYSRLLLKYDFYKKFEDFDYMLIYQTDAWIFEDKIDYWIEKGYDYLGAPWFEGYDQADAASNLLPYCGNGGFTLRNINSMLKLLKMNIKEPKTFNEIVNLKPKKKLISKIINMPIYLFKFLFQKNWFTTIWETTPMFEDGAIIHYAEKYMPDFKLAPSEVAIDFSFEVLPRRLYEMNGYKLPMGCHAFLKYDFEFFKEFINI